MGVTREKKPSQRSLKSQKKAETNSKMFALDIATNETDSACTATIASSLSSSNSFIMSDNSSRTSSTSLQNTSNKTKPTITTPYDSSLVTIKETTGRGLGLFAVRKIREGALVLAEMPTIRFTAEDEAADGEIEQRLRERFDELPLTLRKSYLKLHNARKTGFSKLKSIYFSNCYNLEGPRSILGGSCLAPTASRINHSCIPNVQFSFAEEAPDGLLPAWDHETSDVYHAAVDATNSGTPFSKPGAMLFYAIKDIPAGKEILSNYESAYLLAADRQLKQQMYYGFTCDCHACCPESGNKHWELSDNRRKEMIMCKRQIERAEMEWANAGGGFPLGIVSKNLTLADDSGKVAIAEVGIVIATLVRLSDLLIKEGLKGIELAKTYKKLALWSERAGNLDAAKKWCMHERSTCITAFGAWSLRVSEVEGRLEKLNEVQLVVV